MFTKLVLLFLAASMNQLGAVDDEFQWVHIGVVLDFNSAVGSMADICMSMALKDFYDLNSDYKTRLILHKRQSEDVATTVSNLLENDEVDAVIGPQSLTEAAVVVDLARKFQVPVITFSVTSPLLSPANNPYFIRTAQDDSYLVQALTDILLDFSLHEIVLLYEDTIYADGLVPYLTDELLKSDIKIIDKCAFQTQASDYEISEELTKMRITFRTRFFLVHTMTTSLGYQILHTANEFGLLEELHLWFITGGLSNSLSYLVPLISTDNVIAIRPYIPKSIELANFKSRWTKQLYSTKSDVFLSEPNIFGLWAYDTVWALARAVEDSWTTPGLFYSKSLANYSNPFPHSGKSQKGSRLLNHIFNSKPIQGLSGEFLIVNGQLNPSPLEIIYVEGNGASVARFWIPNKGFSKSLPSPEIASQTREKLQIAVPMKHGFPGMVHEGYCTDVFNAAVDTLHDSLKFDYELVYYPINFQSNKSNAYNELLYQVHDKKIDAVVGDTTICADRWYVDFTLPYSDPDIAIVVPRVTTPEISGYFFNLKPFYLGLWMAVVVAFISTPLVISLLPWIQNKNARNGNLWNHRCMQMASFFGNGENELNFRPSFLMMTFVLLTHVIVSLYPRNPNGKVDLNAKDVYIGYQSGSIIVKDLLLKKLKIDESRIKSYSSLDDYDMALSKGSAKGGVSVIIDETPYLKLFLAKYNSMYKFDGRSYRSHGFAFAFPMGSPLVSHMSKAILNITESGKIEEIET